MLTLRTKRLILRNFHKEDLMDLHQCFGHPETARYENFHPQSLDQTKAMVEKNLGKDNRLVAELIETGEIIGIIGYWINDKGEGEIDCDLNPCYWKKGYALEMCQRLIDFCFNEMGISILIADCDIRNENSWRLLERLGFERVGHKDGWTYKNDAEGHPILINIYLYQLKKIPAELKPTR